MTKKIDTVFKAITDRITRALPSDTVKNPKLNVNSTSQVLSARSYPTEDPQCSTRIHSSINTVTICSKQSDESQNHKPEKEDDMMFIEIIKKNDDSREEDPEVDANAKAEELEVECFDIFPTRSELAYHKGDPNRRVSNFMGRIKEMHVFVGNFTYIIDFMIVEDISSIIDPRLSQVVLGKPFIEISNMTHDPPEGVVRNEEDKRRGVEYVMGKILGFYKECLELGPEYLTGIADEGEVT
ncbi:hypothetical protein Tco_0658091 [Tanacetum coccineum]